MTQDGLFASGRPGVALLPVVAGGADPGVRDRRTQYPGVGAPGYNRDISKANGNEPSLRPLAVAVVK